MMTTWEAAGIVVSASTVLGLIAGAIKNWDTITEKWKKMTESRKVRFAKKQQPYCALICQAPVMMTEVSKKLDKIFDFIEITREISLENHGMALIDRCNKFIEKGFMPQHEKDALIHSFIPYVIGDGNGKVFNYVQMAMNLPTEPGGHECVVDMDEIIRREIEKYHKRKEMLKQGK